MRYTLFGSLSLLLILSLIGLASPHVCAARPAAAVQPAAASSASSAEEPLNKARESFIKKDYRKAASEIRQAAGILENEAATAAGQAKQDLTESGQALQKLADRVEKKAVKSEKELNNAFARAEQALARSSRNTSSKQTGTTAPIRMVEKATGAVDLSMAIMQVAKQAMPAVVYIEVTESQEVENPFGPLEQSPELRRFFGIPKLPPKLKQEVKGLGTGMIIDDKGHILTNYHVAGTATKMQVTLADGTRYPAKLVGGDAKTDLAVIHISAGRSLPHITFGDSDAVEVGQWVVAIGAPRALEKSVTQGIISAMHRTGITDPNSYEDFLQSDAPLNPGNSGGPLLDLHGQVIGVNAAIASESGGFEGIGFTIPSRMAVYVANALLLYGKVERGWLGVNIRSLTPDLAKEVHAGTTAGALVVEVVKGSPAEKAGLKKNDVIVAYGNRDVPDAAALRNEAAETPVGSEVKVTVLRNGRKQAFTVRIGSMQQAEAALSGIMKKRLGAEVRAPNAEETKKYGLEANQGVVITQLDPKSALRQAGFEVGDMILEISGHPVEGVDSFVALVNAMPPGKRIPMVALDHRTGNMVEIVVTMQ